MKLLLIQIIIIALMLAFYNAYIILWGVNTGDYRRKKWSKIWHGIGWFIRFELAVLIANIIYLIDGFDWFVILQWELMYINIAALLYDLIINIVRFNAVGSPPILYIDNKGINAFFLKYLGFWGYWIARALFLIGSTCLLFIHI